MQTMIAHYAGTYAVCRQVALSQLHTWRERGCPYECDCAYAEGQLDAHYPVPAIRYTPKVWRGSDSWLWAVWYIERKRGYWLRMPIGWPIVHMWV